MPKNKGLAVIILLGLLTFLRMDNETLGQTAVQQWQVTSPNQALTLVVTQAEAGALTYAVNHTKNGTTTEVIHPSRLGIVREDQSFTDNLIFDSAEPLVIIDEAYTMTTGKQRQLRNHAHELTLNFHNADNARLQIILRAYDDGVAFRYRFPEDDATPRKVLQELTTFTVSEEGRLWSQPYDTVTMYAPAYETLYAVGAPIGLTASFVGGTGWSFPALFQIGDHWVLLSEADLTGNYFGAHLGPRPKDGVYELVMPLVEEGQGVGAAEPISVLPWATPWRVIMVAKNVGTILESSLTYHLSTPSQIADTSWIHPGRASWSWWSDHGSSRDYDSLVRFIDLAAEMGWEYSLVDANWNIMRGGNVEQLIDYANEKNVGVLLWYNSGGPHNRVTEQPRDLMFDSETRRAEFARIQALGVKGVKVDFFQSDKPNIIRLYLDILQDAADFQLLVNFHGSTLPRGWSRTWPNLMSMEAVRGAEVYTFDNSYARIAAKHNTILPFTRNAVGPMDYTPVTFTDALVPHETTNSHELALAIVFELGILHLADSVESYRSLPDEPKAFLRDVPVVWDETRYLAGEPGTYVVLARRNGDAWYIGGISGQDAAQEVALDLSFLNDAPYTMLLIEDAEDGRHFNATTREISPSDELNVTMLPKGGFVIQLNPASR